MPFAACVLLSACADASRVEHEALPECADPVQGPRFSDALPESGVGFVHDAGIALPPGADSSLEDFVAEMSAGVVSADLDRDGHADLLFTQLSGLPELYWGRGDGRFDGPDAAAFVDAPPSLGAGASAADFDGDGLLDLALGALGRLVVLHNRGDRRFEDVTDELGFSQHPGIVAALTWSDPDQDGDLDLFVGRHVVSGDPVSGQIVAGRSQLWRNDVGGFTDASAGLNYPGGDGGVALHARWSDLDGDGDVDLVQANDLGPWHTNSMLLENGGDLAFTDRLDEAGLPLLEAPMGMAVRDLDGDGLKDLWFSSFGPHEIFRAEAPWSYVGVSLVWGAELPPERLWTSWSVVDVDVDGDGRPSLLTTYGPLQVQPPDAPGQPPGEPLAEQPDLLLTGPDWSPDPEAFPSAQIANSRGVGLADFNEDGVPDVVIGHVGGPPSLLLGRCTAARRLVVRLVDPSSYNRFAIGAEVTVEGGGASQVQEVVAGGRGTFSGSEPELFFGVGDAELVDLVVRWPDGEEDRFEALSSGGRVTIERS